VNPHRRLFSHYPFVQLALAFSAGICAAHYFRTPFALIAAAVCSLLALVFVLKAKTAGFVLLFAIFFAGAALAGLERRADESSELRRVVEQSANESVTLTGVLDGPPEFARDRVYLSLRVESVSDKRINGRVSLLASFRNVATADEYRSRQLGYGTRIRVKTTLDRTGNYRNPGVSPLSEHLDRRGFDATGIVRNPGAIQRLDDTRVFAPLARLYQFRETLQREIDTRFAPETAGVLDAALLGNRYNLSPSAAERFREGGTFHVLVISGLHISFLGGVVFLIVRRLTRRRWLQFVLPAMVVWSYSIAVGAEASVVRAALMFSFAGFAAIVFREASSLNALGAAALLLLVQSPKQIFDPSFQLTYLSVLAIVVIAWPLLLKLSAIGSWYPRRSTPYPPACSPALKSFCEILFWSERKWQRELARSAHDYRLFKAPAAVWLERYHVQRCLRYVFGAVVVSTSVQLVLLPLMIVYFHRLSLALFVLNIVVSVLLAALVAVALSALLLAQVSVVLSAPLSKLADLINWLMVHSVDPFSSFAAVRLPEYSGAVAAIYALYYLPLLLLIATLSHWRPLALSKERRCKLHRFVKPTSLAQVLIIALLLLHPFSAGRADGKLHVDFLDVGQGDSALITMPDGTTLLVDGGGNITDAARRIGETVVSEYLWWRGLNEIDYILATHADADHIDGLNDVLKNFKVRSAFVARKPGNDPEFAKFLATLTQTNTHAETLQAGDAIYFGDVEVSVLWPAAGGELSTNNDSLVLRVRYGDRSILLTGDIEKQAERALVESRQDLRADVVKVPHHGSKTSSTSDFVNATKPTLAIVSVGLNSRFGHPHEEVVQRWKASGANVLTTGVCGTITVTTDGKQISLKTFIEPQKR
jgi:competence protein ComEC